MKLPPRTYFSRNKKNKKKKVKSGNSALQGYRSILYICYIGCDRKMIETQAVHISLLSNSSVGALIRNVGPSYNMIILSSNMAAVSHT